MRLVVVLWSWRLSFHGSDRLLLNFRETIENFEWVSGKSNVLPAHCDHFGDWKDLFFECVVFGNGS